MLAAIDDGSSQVHESDPNMYAIDNHFSNRGSWRSYMYLGGRGGRLIWIGRLMPGRFGI